MWTPEVITVYKMHKATGPNSVPMSDDVPCNVAVEGQQGAVGEPSTPSSNSSRRKEIPLNLLDPDLDGDGKVSLSAEQSHYHRSPTLLRSVH